MATHSSFLAWEIPWTEEPVGLQSVRSQTVGHDRVTTNKTDLSKLNNNKTDLSWELPSSWSLVTKITW